VSDVAKLSMTILQRISEFLASLPEDQLADIAEGRATLTYHPYGAVSPVVPAQPATTKAATPRKAPAQRQPTVPAPGVAEAVAELGRMASRDEGQRYLQLMKVGDLRAVAAALGIGGVSKTVKADLIALLVERTIGSRLNSAAVRAL
jgi:hypothetical protein